MVPFIVTADKLLNGNRQLAESGAHVVMAVRRTKLAHELIQNWQNDKSEIGLILNVEVCATKNTSQY